jgi:hypothetical protein
VRRILLGYGQFKSYHLCELPQDELQALSERFPLTVEKCQNLDWNEILITVAVNEELARRAHGGKAEKRRPSERELARDVISKGFQQVSKQHHPDKQSGDAAVQNRLTAVREQLLLLVSQIAEDSDLEDTIFICEPPSFRGRRDNADRDNDPFGGTRFTDDDVPF